MNKYLYCIAIYALLTACNTTEKKAVADYEKAKSLYEQQDYFAAKSMIDTIRQKYPQEYDILKESLQLMRSIELKETERTVAYCDSLIPLREAELLKLKKAFSFEKDSIYEQVGHYIWKSQTVERNTERCYIRCGVSEKGEMYLASIFYGKGALKHTSIKISVPKTELTAETVAVPYDGGMNYRFEDMGNTTEVVTYKDNKAKDVIKLIYDNAKQRIRIQYVGGRPYVIYMAELDKRSIVATYELAMVLSDLETMRNEKEKATKKVAYLNSKKK